MNELLMPGDELAASEEYISGDGTYEDEGIIYAAIIGQKDFDEAEKICFELCAGCCEFAFCHANLQGSGRNTGHRQYSWCRARIGEFD